VKELFDNWGDRRCVMGREITKKFEEFFRGEFSDLLSHLNQKAVKGEIVLIVEGTTTISKNQTNGKNFLT
jgi:16S rRNA (cytidine1402-2'-O)-methyltransferase